MNKEELIFELKKLNLDFSDETINKLIIYKDFLLEYNSHTNLTAIKTEEEVFLKHFYDSLTITKVVDLKKYNTLIDIGTGAGFPGMVLKVFFPHLNITLLDSNNKKTKFLSELKEKLNLEVNIVNSRVEDYSKVNLNKFDIVTSRAVANLRVLSELSLPLIKTKGLFIPMKGILDENLEDSKETIEIMNGKILNKVTFELYNNSGTRNILVVEKHKDTEIGNIRTYDKILKKPLKKKNK